MPCWGIGIRYTPMYDGMLGYVWRDGCTVYLNSHADWHHSWHRLCATMIHEYGHIVGYGHTRKYGSIMYPNIKRFWYCNGG